MGWRATWQALRMPHKLRLRRLMLELRSLMRLHFVHAAAEAGLLQALRQRRPRAELVERLQIERPELLEVLLDLGQALGELGREGERFWLKGELSRALAEPENDALLAMVQGQVTYYNNVFRALPARLKGAALSDELGRIGALVARISVLTEPYMQAFVRAQVARRGPLRLLDVGCGAGAHLRLCAELNPEARGQGLDQDPAVAAQARDNVQRWGLAERFEVLTGDIRQAPPGLQPRFDLIFLISMIYYIAPAERAALLATLRARLAEGGALIVASTCQAQGRDVWAANLDAATRSMQGCAALPALDQLQAQLREAGFARLSTSQLMPGSTFYGVVAKA